MESNSGSNSEPNAEREGKEEERESESICPICRCPIEESQPSVTTSCSHPYHYDCFMRMAQTSDTCCICRASLYGDADGDADAEGANTETATTQVVEIEVSQEDMRNLRQQVRSRLSSSRRDRRNRTDNEDDEGEEGDDSIQILDFGEDAELRRSRMIFTIFQACEHGQLARVRSIISEDDEFKHAMDDENNTLVHEAVFSNNETLLRYLVNDLNLSTNSTNCHGMTPLHFAAFAKSTRTSSLLLNCGAFVDPRNDSGQTPLMIACQKSDNSTCNVLLDRGASVRAIDKNGECALHHAVRGKCLSCIRTLLRHPREDPNCCNFVGETPLHTACCVGSYTAVRFLLDNGGDPDIKNRAGLAPIDIIPRENARLRRLIQSHSRL